MACQPGQIFHIGHCGSLMVPHSVTDVMNPSAAHGAVYFECSQACNHIKCTTKHIDLLYCHVCISLSYSLQMLLCPIHSTLNLLYTYILGALWMSVSNRWMQICVWWWWLPFCCQECCEHHNTQPSQVFILALSHRSPSFSVNIIISTLTTHSSIFSSTFSSSLLHFLPFLLLIFTSSPFLANSGEL